MSEQPKLSPDTRYCPRCDTDLQDRPIPENSRIYNGGHTHFSKVIGIYDRARDRTVAYRCPECGFEAPVQG